MKFFLVKFTFTIWLLVTSVFSGSSGLLTEDDISETKLQYKILLYRTILNGNSIDNALIGEAVKYHTRKEYRKSLDIYAKACNKGILEGCYRITLFYFITNKDYKNTASLFEKTCDKEHMDSCKELGDMYKNGWGVKKDYKKYEELHQKVCYSGDTSACYFLGVYYFTDSNDKAKAAKFIKLACDGNHFEACSFLGWMHKDGLGLKKNKNNAKSLYKKACDGGYKSACEDYKKIK